MAAHPHSNGVFLTHVGPTGKVFTNYHDSTHWGSVWRDNTAWVVPNSIALAPLREHFWRVANSLDNKIHTSRWIYGQGWHNVETLPSWRTTHAPALATHGDRMWMFWHGGDNVIHTSSHDNLTWAPYANVPAARAADAPAAVSHDGKLYVMYRKA
ncbi:hypothetical protein ACFQ9Q_17530 [Streptomyces virginiae]|uniref:hypothetical protein n=1 Tax=Streptomyces virginiae TaxID=1961 RepID=UPI00369B0EAB